MGTHYSNAQDPFALRRWSASKAEDLKALRKEKAGPGNIVLCYSGMSGIAYATALMLACSEGDDAFIPKMCYIRKAGEKSHGRKAERSELAFDSDIFVFVDDFIDEGKTFKRVKRGVHAEVEGSELKYLCLGRETRPGNTFIINQGLTVI